jgi:2-haloacid dehalogenase
MMKRRQILGLGPVVAMNAALPKTRENVRPPRAPAQRRAVLFDLLTIFDPRSIAPLAEEVAPGHAPELMESWRLRQFEYTWLRTSAGTYRNFEEVTDDALRYAARANHIELSVDARRKLLGGYERLAPWPDAQEVLAALRTAGLRLAPLANFTASTAERLLARAGLRSPFDDVISTERAKTFKPDPRAYALGVTALGLPPSEMAFAAFGGWDAAGAKWFGYPTFWVNRLGLPAEELAPGPDATGTSLRDLASWVLSP